MEKRERNSERRPDPDALLALTEKDRRGRLLVFLGAAPGVGKTYAMLQRAQLLRQEGVDVVVGLVETHGRAETEALTRDLEILPRRVIEAQGRRYEEFDLDAALRRHPKLIIVDELAHTNAPDSRHPKRWQDVEDLLDARIDVWTAMNVQHLDSLADIVSRIAGVTVRETVPDTVLRDADDIVLVDLTSEELIQRLKDGKVYLPETARLAQQKFFTLRNLTALREIALRRAAARVDDQMVEQLRQSAIQGPWASGERILVCVGADKRSLDVVRTASRLATGLNASWVAATVDKPSGEAGSADVGARRGAGVWRKASAPRIERLVGHDLPEEILRYAERENITQIVVGRSRAGLFRRLVGRALSEALARRASLIGVHIVTGDKPREAPQIGPLARLLDRSLPIGALAAAAAVGGRSRSPGGRGARRWIAAAQSVDDFSHRGGRLRGALWRALGHSGGGAFVSCLRLLLRAAALPVHHRRAAGVLRPHHFSCRGEPGWLARRPGARSGAAGARKRAGDALAL